MKQFNLTKKTIGVIAAAFAGVLLIGTGVVRATQPPDSITIEEAVSIALKDAGKSQEEVTVTKQRPDMENGYRTYDVEFFFFEGDASVTEYDYEIDAATGRILERSRETEYVTRTPKKQELWDNRNTANSGTSAGNANTADGGASTAPANAADSAATTSPAPATPVQPQTPAPQPQTPAAPAQNAQQYIGIEQAKSIALSHAGVGSDVYFTKERQDFEDGIVVYEIEFYVGHVEYDYEIDAVTGAIWDYDIDYDD